MGIDQLAAFCKGCGAILRQRQSCVTCASRTRERLHARGIAAAEGVIDRTPWVKETLPYEQNVELVCARRARHELLARGFQRAHEEKQAARALLRLLASFGNASRPTPKRDKSDVDRLVDAIYDKTREPMKSGQVFVHVRAPWPNERVARLRDRLRDVGWRSTGRCHWLTPEDIHVISASSESDVKGRTVDRSIVDDDACPHLINAVRRNQLRRSKWPSTMAPPPAYELRIPGDVETGKYAFRSTTGALVELFHKQGWPSRHVTYARGARFGPTGPQPSRYYERFDGGPLLRRDAERIVRGSDGSPRVERPNPPNGDPDVASWNEAFNVWARRARYEPWARKP